MGGAGGGAATTVAAWPEPACVGGCSRPPPELVSATGSGAAAGARSRARRARPGSGRCRGRLCDRGGRRGLGRGSRRRLHERHGRLQVVSGAGGGGSVVVVAGGVVSTGASVVTSRSWSSCRIGVVVVVVAPGSVLVVVVSSPTSAVGRWPSIPRRARPQRARPRRARPTPAERFALVRSRGSSDPVCSAIPLLLRPLRAVHRRRLHSRGTAGQTPAPCPPWWTIFFL